APAPVAAERTPGHRSLNVLKRSKSSLESQRRFGSRVGSGGSLRGERTPGISERVDGDSLLVSIARALDLLRRDDYFAQRATCAHALNSIAQSTGGSPAGPHKVVRLSQQRYSGR